MIVRHFDIHTPKTKPPSKNGWEQARHGYYWMSKCLSTRRKMEIAETYRIARDAGQMHELDFENDCFLSILSDIKKQHVTLFELGAGWGDWCLALAGVIDHKIIPVKPISYRCLAVEGEPTHYEWTKEHFEIQNINGDVVHGAVSDKDGTCRFSIHAAPEANYGQAMIPPVKSKARRFLRNIYNFVFRNSKIPTIEIPTYTVDYLVKKYRFEHIDIIHMDVQGAEYKVIQGAATSIKENLIDYLLIGTHEKTLNDKLRQLLSPNFDLIVNIYTNSIGIVDGFAPVKCQDGIQLYKRKNI